MTKVAMASIREQLAAARATLESASSFDTPESAAAIGKILNYAEKAFDKQAEDGKLAASGIVRAALEGGFILRTIQRETNLSPARAKKLAAAIDAELQRFIALVKISVDAVSQSDLVDADGPLGGGEGESA